MSRTVVSNVQVLTAGTRYDQEQAKRRQAAAVHRRDAGRACRPTPSASRSRPTKARSRWRCATRSTSSRTTTKGIKLAALMPGTGPEAGTGRAERIAWCPPPSRRRRRRSPPVPSDLQGRNHPRREAVGRGGALNMRIHAEPIGQRPVGRSGGGCDGRDPRSLYAAQAAPPLAPVAAGGTERRDAERRAPRIAHRGTIDGADTDFDITRIAVTNPAIADAVVVQPREMLVDGKAPGTISLIVWGGDAARAVRPRRRAADRGARAAASQLFPGETISGDDQRRRDRPVGHACRATQVMLRAGRGGASRGVRKANVINMLQVPGGSDAQQVMLQVRIAEVNRKRAHGAGRRRSSPAPAASSGWIGRATDAAVPGAGRSTAAERAGVQRLPEPLPVQHQVERGHADRALKQTGYFQSLAEPNLIAYNGQEASFLAGGEFPVPIVQRRHRQVSMQFKEFGVRLNFTPTIAGDLIRLKVRPEVSSLDFNNGVTLAGLPHSGADDAARRNRSRAARRPVVRDRRADRQHRADRRRGDPDPEPAADHRHLFKSKADRKERTELLVLITPRLVRPLNPGRGAAAADDAGTVPAARRRSSATQLQGGGGTVDAPRAGQRTASTDTRGLTDRRSAGGCNAAFIAGSRLNGRDAHPSGAGACWC